MSMDPSSGVAAGPPKPRVYFYVSSAKFRLAWVGIVAILASVWLYLTCYTVLYSVTYVTPNVQYLVSTFQLMDRSQYPIVAATYGIVALLFLRSLASIVATSIRTRQLSFEEDAKQTSPKLKARRPWMRAIRRRLRPLRHWLRWLLAYTGVHGAGFKAAKVAQISVQIGIQTIQAYDMARFTANRTINVVFGLLLLTNCFAVPVVHRVYSTNQAKERMVLLLIDLFVDVMLLLVPTTLVAKYLKAYLGTELAMFEDTYGARAIKELRLVLVTSPFNLLTKFVPSLSVLLTTTNITDLLRRVPDGTMPIASQRSVHLDSSATSRRLLNQASDLTRAQYARLVDGLSSKEKWFRYLFLAWGVVVAVLYVLAFSLPGTCQAGCELVLRPWFTWSKCRCAVQEINCFDRGISGDASELVHIFSQLERTGLATIVIKHCPALEIPPELHWFQDLYALDIYNCSIVSFDESAALSSTHYSRLGSLYITRTNISEIPGALLQGNLPPTLREIGIIVSNLRTLPDDLHVKWPRVRTLYLEHGNLRSFPSVLGRMQVDSLSLYNNSIATIPDTALQTSSFNYLQLSSNPLRALPSTLGDTSALYELLIQFTDIASLSAAWISGAKLTATTRLYAVGSRLCGGAGDIKGLPLDTASQDQQVTLTPSITALCHPRVAYYHGETSYTYYPLEGKTIERNQPSQ